MFSLEGVALLFVRRDTGKEFGPFPTEKIKTLVKQGKMKGSEHVSQDRVVWHLIKDVKEFADILNIAVSNSGAPQDTHESSDLPGLKVSGRSELPGHKASGGSELPGLKVSGGSELPGLKASGGSEL
ncbi:hypothetical protein KKF84_17330, partial [Myxococcota bacterium]|nr:hypothetical protein [Myxococcota bacterium]